MNKTIFFIISIVIILTAFSIYNYEHEKVHAQACKYYGGSVKEFVVWPFNSKVVCNQTNKEQVLIDSINEIVGYNTGGLFVLLLIIVILLLKKDFGV